MGCGDCLLVGMAVGIVLSDDEKLNQRDVVINALGQARLEPYLLEVGEKI